MNTPSIEERLVEVITEMREYVRKVEEQIDWEWGSCRNWESLYKAGRFPDFYDKLPELIGGTTLIKTLTTEGK